jgi:hypothetical protein
LWRQGGLFHIYIISWCVKTKILKFTGFIVILFLSACSIPQYVTVPVNYNPKLPFRPDTTTILIINRLDLSRANINAGKKLDVIKAGAFTSVRYAEIQLKQLPHVGVINLVDSGTFNITTDSIKFLALKYHSDYVLSLENFSANIVLADVQNSTSYYNTTVEVNYTLYEGNGTYSKKLNGTAADHQSMVPYVGFIGSLIIHPTIRGSKSVINISAQDATFNALQDYLPNSISHQRPLYNDPAFQPAVKEILAGNFDKADSLLVPFLKDISLHVVSKAAYNLAVVYEAEGNIDAAINMAQLSLDKYPNEYATNIFDDLKWE